MSRVAARTTQADISRALRAAKQCGAASIEIKPDGTIQIVVKPELYDGAIKTLAPEPEIVL